MLVELLVAATLLASPPSGPSFEGPQALAPVQPLAPVPPPKLVRPVQQRPAGAVYNPAAEPGIGLRRYGLGVTVIGSVLGIGAVIAARTNPCGHDGANGSHCISDTRNAVAMILGVASLGAITGGVISMSIGQAQRRKARLELAKFGVTLRGEGGGTLVLLGRF